MAQTLLRDYLQQTEDAITAGRIEDALEHCQHILVYYPDALEAQRLLGEVYLKQERLGEAQQTFDWVLTNDPENVIVYCDRALISERMDDYDTALDCYQQAYELSRGNSQIRQEFNHLSVKAGQQGFMFSRAGLARLYMRGDLLYQAIQEWEAVLAISPDRLDARLGLLETFWRENQYDSVKQLATQILEDVPNCLKALLLLAHITFKEDGPRSRKLLQKAETLDPELQMAQDLFSDLMARQPGDPFFQLLKREPVVLDLSTASAIPAPSSSSYSNEIYGSEAPRLPSDLMDVSSEILSNWQGLDDWGTADTILRPGRGSSAEAESLLSRSYGSLSASDQWQDQPQDVLAPQLTPSTVNAGNDETIIDPWGVLDRAEPARHAALSQEEIISDPWSALDRMIRGQTGDDNPSASWQPAEDEEASRDDAVAQNQNRNDFEGTYWNEHDYSIEPSVPSVQAAGRPEFAASDEWNTTGSSETTYATNEGEDWSTSVKEPTHTQDSPAVPTWLSILTQNDPWPSSTATPSAASQSEQPSAQEHASTGPSQAERSSLGAQESRNEQEDAVYAESQWQDEAAGNSGQPWEEELQSTFNSTASASEQDDESFSFGPEWLKSLGAATIDNDTIDSDEEAESVPAAPAASASMMPQSSQPARDEYPAAFNAQNYDEQEETPYPVSQAERDYLATLEDLDQDLISQGFVPLEPKSLSSIAQSQAPAPTGESNSGFEPEQSERSTAAKERQEESGVSSALAQLGNIVQQAQTQQAVQRKQPTQPQQPVQRRQPTQPQQPVRPVPQPVVPVAPVPLAPAASVQSNEKQIVPGDEPPWMTPLRSTPAPTAVPAAPLAQREEPAARIPTAPLAALAQENTKPALAAVAQSGSAATRPLNPVSPGQGPLVPQTSQEAPMRTNIPNVPAVSTSTTAQQPAVQAPVQTPVPARAPVVYPDSQLDELETTMKRPAIRLQTMVQKGKSAPQDPVALMGKARTASPSMSGGTISYKERLVKGYQHQLLGDYDEAMQEYRIIIRSAPELLGEVVSNVRALLKLAPKYSAGYRVLGDAYMRQGEYLQAMEAYNKALTMAKRAKGY